MKLFGYIRPCKEFSFTIPVYFERDNFFYHKLNDKFIIDDFIRSEIDLNFLIKIKRQPDYNLGDMAPIVFIGGKGKKIIKTPDKAILEICKYLDQSDYPKKYIQEEVFYLSTQLNHNIEIYKNKFELKILVYDNHPIIFKDIIEIVSVIEKYIKRFKTERKRKSSFKYLKKTKKSFGSKIAPYNQKKIDDLKFFIVKDLNENRIRKSFHELLNLLNYQKKVSPPQLIIKSFCDLSKTMLAHGYPGMAKILLYLSKNFMINDIVIDTQFAEVLKTEGDFQGAKELYLKIQKQYPTDIVAKTGFAEVLKAEGNLNGAKELYLEIQKQYPNDIFAQNGLAEVLKAEGDLEGAKNMYIKIRNKFPNDKITRSGLAEVLKAEGDVKGAKKIYKEIQREFPDDVVAKCGFAGVLKKEGYIQEAKKIYLEVQKQYPNDIFAKNGLAEVLKAEGDINGAIEMYLDIQEDYPRDLYSKQALITCYLINHDLNLIDHSFFIKSNPKSKHDYYFYHSYILYNIKTGDYEEAENLILEEIDTISLWDTKILYNQTLVYIKLLQKKYRELLEEIDVILPVDGNNIVNNVFKTHIYSVNEMKKEARFFLDIIKSYPTKSIFYSNASLLSERYDLNGLPRKGLDNDTLDKLIKEEEFKLIGVFE